MENGKQPNEEPKQAIIQKTAKKVSDVKSRSRSISPIAAIAAVGTVCVACVAPAETMNMVYGGAAACVMSSSSSSGYVPHARGGYVADDSSDEESVFDVEEDSHPSLGKRKRVEYNQEQLDIMSCDCGEIEHQIKRMKLTKRYISYENQTSVAININNLFNNLSVVIQMVIGYTQSGKTGCMVELIDQMMKNKSNPISIQNIFIITGLSSIDWVKQTMERFPECIRHHVFHLGKLDDFKAAVAGKQNVLIIVDEAHMASKKKQTMSRIFKELNWKLDYMMENDIKLVQFSATPDGLIFALNGPKWPEEHYKITTMKPGCSYFGAKQMNERKQLKQIKDIYGRNKDGSWISVEVRKKCLENISEILRDQLSFQEPRYLLVRIRGGTPEQAYHENFLEAIKSLTADKQEMFEKKFLHYNMRGNVTDISKQFHESPKKHTIVFIKEKMKCAQTLEYVVLDEKTGKTETHKVKHNIGVVVERLTKNDSFTIQGLLGRLCGYEQHNCICYTNLESFEKYEELFDSNFDTEKLELVSWNSNTTLGRGDGRGTNVYPTVNDECVDDETSSSEVVVVDASAIHSTQAAAKSWAVEHLNLGALKTKTVSYVTEFNADKTKNTQNRGTHINPRNHFEPIPTEESILAKHDLSLKFGGGVRIIPVRMPGDDAPNQYVVIYDKKWLKQQP